MKKTSFNSDTLFLVVLKEVDKNWGQRDFAVFEFPTHKEAKERKDKINNEGLRRQSPHYYIQARIVKDPTEFDKYLEFL